jgi:hypothetical protein
MDISLKYGFSFPPHTFSLGEVLGMARNGEFGFTATHAMCGKYGRLTPARLAKIAAWPPERALKEMKSGVQFADGPEDQRWAHILHPFPYNTQVINIYVDGTGAIPPVVGELAAHRNLFAGYCANDRDHSLQNAYSKTSYAVLNEPVPQGLRTCIDFYDEPTYDTSENPGRFAYVQGGFLVSCWRVWYGPGFFAQVPKERLLAFGQARQATELPGGNVFLELYEHAHEAGLPTNREVQRAFRHWAGLDQLENILHAQPDHYQKCLEAKANRAKQAGESAAPPPPANWWDKLWGRGR